MSLRRWLLLAVWLVAIVPRAMAAVPDACQSAWILNPVNAADPCCNYFTCPQGFNEGPDPMLPVRDWNWTADITVRDAAGLPCPAIPPADFWVEQCDVCNGIWNVFLCNGAASSNADGATNAVGQTTMSVTSIVGGGCTNHVVVVVQGVVISDCVDPLCLPVEMRSPDINGDGIVNVQDLGAFAVSFNGPYEEWSDFNFDNTVNIQDLGRFAYHFGHCCPGFCF